MEFVYLYPSFKHPRFIIHFPPKTIHFLPQTPTNHRLPRLWSWPPSMTRASSTCLDQLMSAWPGNPRFFFIRFFWTPDHMDPLFLGYASVGPQTKWAKPVKTSMERWLVIEESPRWLKNHPETVLNHCDFRWFHTHSFLYRTLLVCCFS
jgi:hypothetical protein